MANVLLLRAPSHGEEDRYETAFKESGYQPTSVPALETISTNLSALKDLIKNGPTAKELEGVVITSARSCEAWKTAVDELMTDPVSTMAGEDSWNSTAFYVVGQATASALAEVRQTHGQTPYTPEIICGETSGTGERLAQFILDLHVKPKRLLYLTGDKNRDTVPLMLGKAGIDLYSLKVYETRGSLTFEQDLIQGVTQSHKELHQWWIVHFSPSAAAFTTPILAKHLDFSSASPINDRVSVSIPKARVAAIGSVTAAFLRDELRIYVHAAPLKSTPQDLVSAILAYDLDSSS
ncbi:hypothetical protein H0H92_002005 [Tricholoma furcatifolium]|nr:hypothetical protein H0H92_002005 [Tricholoma furcatifolium]